MSVQISICKALSRFIINIIIIIIIIVIVIIIIAFGGVSPWVCIKWRSVNQRARIGWVKHKECG